MQFVTLPRPHDLLELEVSSSLSPFIVQGAPTWALCTLAQTPWLTVRRGSVSAERIPAGVRGLSRDQRWACSLQSFQIKRIVRPWEIPLARTLQTLSFPFLRPALDALADLHAHWNTDGYSWGPYGSVAFELMTGVECTRKDSDLDLVLDGSRPMSRRTARFLCQGLATQKIRVDVLVETPTCGFWLSEFAYSDDHASILLRTAAGPRFSSDPWSEF